MLANHHYKDALQILEQASVLDGGDINLYILKTDAYLALDQQEKAVQLLEQALHFLKVRKGSNCYLNWQMCMMIMKNLTKCSIA